MKILLLLAVVGAMCVPCTGQVTGVLPITKDTTAKPPPIQYNGEIDIMAGGEKNGFSFGFAGRYLFIHAMLHLSNFSKAQKPSGQLDYPPPHKDYVLIPFRTANYGFSAGPYFRPLRFFALYGLIGFDSYEVAQVPTSTATGWYYKTVRTDEYTNITYGGGVTFYPVGKLAVGGGYLSEIGVFFLIGAQM